MYQSPRPDIVTFTVTYEAAHFIIDCVADRPFKQVAPLLSELQAVMQVQANTSTESERQEQAAGDGAIRQITDGKSADATPAT